MEEPDWTASVSAGSCELVGADAGAGLAVCSSGVAATSWLGGAGLAFAGTGEIPEGCAPVCWSGPGTVSWLVGAALVGASACTVCVSFVGCDVSCAGVGACVWPVGVGPVGVGLALADVGEAVGVSPTAACSDVGAEFWLIGAALSGAFACAACVWVVACEVADVGAAV